MQPFVYSYRNPAAYAVEADASSATYPLAFAAVTGGEVTVHGVGTESLQGDADFCLLLEKMGCTVTRGPDFTTVKGDKLKAIEVDMAAQTDAVSCRYQPGYVLLIAFCSFFVWLHIGDVAH